MRDKEKSIRRISMLRRAVSTARASAPEGLSAPHGVGAHQALARWGATRRSARACVIDAWWHRPVGDDRSAPGGVARSARYTRDKRVRVSRSCKGWGGLGLACVD